MLKKTIETALNKQVNAELWSAYLYLAMEAHFISVNLNGFANWMRLQAQEELGHAMKMYDYIGERDGKVTLTAITAPKDTWKTPLAVFQDTLKHEIKVTELINNLTTLADKEKDHATRNFLQWFVDEQVEEESTASNIVEQIKLAGNSSGALFILDRELALRVASPAPAA
ncbi:MAG: ferritin [Candidatus Latescibacterota bacterium]